ncbi:MAG TPA: hypothetical protein GXX14_03660 [Clostridiaceae bacterium]|nr:hypothetical protein [Clostridiaceae bacterium]
MGIGFGYVYPEKSSEKNPVKVKVTVDGITVESEPVQIQMKGSNIAGTAEVSVISVRKADGSIDERYTGDYAVDGDRETSWHRTLRIIQKLHG